MSAQWPRPPLGWAGSQSRAWAQYRAELRESAARPCEYAAAAEMFPAEYVTPCPPGRWCRNCEARWLAWQEGQNMPDRTDGQLDAAARVRDTLARERYACPLCGADRGEHCTHAGHPVSWTHPDRWRLFEVTK